MKINLKRLSAIAVAAAAGSAAVGYFAFSLMTRDLPDIAALKQYRPPVTTTIVSRDGVLMAELAEENRYLIDPANLPRHVVQAFVAAEDEGFFEHKGIDYLGIVRAMINNLRHGRVVQGGSTITQQVAKALLLTPEKSIRRKVREAVLAVRMEENLTKEEILNLYLNQIYLGHGAYGIEAAAKVYFGVGADKLTLAQSALLAGLPQAPSAYDPYRRPEEALKRRGYVLEQMADNGFITSEKAREVAAEPLSLSYTENFFKRISPYFTEQVRRELEARYGNTEILRNGLKVVATMDSRLQAAAQKALRNGIESYDRRQGYRGYLRRNKSGETAQFEKGQPPLEGEVSEALVTASDDSGITLLTRGRRYAILAGELEWATGEGRSPARRFTPGDVILVKFAEAGKHLLKPMLYQEPQVEGAIVCLDAHTGEVLAAVGGYSFDKSQFNRVTQAKRQAGSAIKPLIYGAAVERGFTPAYVVYDSPIIYDAPGLEEKWKPKNYSDKFYGPTTLREALVQSRNVVTIKVLQDVGVSAAINFMKRAGIGGEIEPNLSLALGSCVVTPLELTAAYGVFATGGFRHEPAFIQSVADREGRVLQRFVPPIDTTPLIDPKTTFIVNNMMQGVINEGTGGRAKGLPVPAAGKTGTTNEARDAWFIGFTPELLTGVWIGNDDGTSIGSGETGGLVAAPIWKEFMETAIERRDTGDFPMPAGIEFALIDADTGQLAGPRSKRTFSAAFLAGTAPVRGRRLEMEAPKAGGGRGKSFDADDPGAMDVLR